MPVSDADAWAWAAAGGQARADGDHLSASVFYAEALVRDPAPALRQRQRECWAAAAADLGGRPAAFGGTVVLAAVANRPVLVVDPGERTVAEAWNRTGAGAGARGLHWAAFEAGTSPADVACELTARDDAGPLLLLGLAGLRGDLSAYVAAVAIGPTIDVTGAPVLQCPGLYLDPILDWLLARVAT